MDIRRFNPHVAPPEQELSETLRRAVEQVKDEPVPEDAMGRALAKARGLGNRRRPGKAWRRGDLVAAASIAALFLVGLLLTGKPHNPPTPPSVAKSRVDDDQQLVVVADPRETKYSVYEIIDLINEGLLANESTQKYILLNRQRSFCLVPASDRIDPGLVDRFTEEDLDEHGDSEIVSVAFQVKGALAANLLPRIESLKGRFGEVIVFEEANQLLVLDQIKNLKRMRDMIKEVENPGWKRVVQSARPHPWAEKKHEFNMDGEKWDKVFERLTEISGKKIITSYHPAGSLMIGGPQRGRNGRVVTYVVGGKTLTKWVPYTVCKSDPTGTVCTTASSNPIRRHIEDSIRLQGQGEAQKMASEN